MYKEEFANGKCIQVQNNEGRWDNKKNWLSGNFAGDRPAQSNNHH